MLASLALVGSAAAAEPALSAAADVARPLELRSLYVQRGGTLVVAPEVEALAGKRVRVRGFMVQMELAPPGAFYLAPHPVEQDESGGGTADIPVDSVQVRVPAVADREIPWRPGPVELEGLLEVGRDEDAEGRVTTLRVIMVEPSGG
jgi:hypothetical protein